jgi:hypothetical protein
MGIKKAKMKCEKCTNSPTCYTEGRCLHPARYRTKRSSTDERRKIGGHPKGMFMANIYEGKLGENPEHPTSWYNPVVVIIGGINGFISTYSKITTGKRDIVDRTYK